MKSDSDINIKVAYLSKCYPIYDNPRDRLKQFVAPRLQRITWQNPKQYFREFWAFKDVFLKSHLSLHRINNHTLGG